MSIKRPFIKFVFILTSILLLVACGSTPDPTTVPTDNPQPTMVENTAPSETAISVPVKDKPKPTSEAIKPTTSPTPTPEPAPTYTPQPTVTTGPIDLPARDARTIPNVFVGSVTVNGQVAIDGTKVSAWVFDYSSPVGETTVSNGSYVMNVSQYGTVSFDGKTITFKIEDVDTSQTSTWVTGGATIVDLVAN